MSGQDRNVLPIGVTIVGTFLSRLCSQTGTSFLDHQLRIELEENDVARNFSAFFVFDFYWPGASGRYRRSSDG